MIPLLLVAVMTGTEPPQTGDAMVCSIIRGYVSLYGEAAAREYARLHRWSRARVAEAEKCLKQR